VGRPGTVGAEHPQRGVPAGRLSHGPAPGGPARCRTVDADDHLGGVHGVSSLSWTQRAPRACRHGRADRRGPDGHSGPARDGARGEWWGQQTGKKGAPMSSPSVRWVTTDTAVAVGDAVFAVRIHGRGGQGVVTAAELLSGATTTPARRS